MGWRAALLLAAFACGCLKSGSVVCADGVTVCPEGTLCVQRVDGSNFCASPDDLAACNGKAEGETCGTGRRCYALAEGTVCSDAGCGNGFVDVAAPDFPFDEQCDDSNTITGDGCSADCTSTERCGNNVIDLINGETCDDGNLLSRDGCSSACGTEMPTWVSFSEPSGRTKVSLAYDARRGRVVMFGGASTNAGSPPLDDLWEWHSHWEPLNSLTRPLARHGAAMAYDIARGELVVFGGLGLSLYADTQIWMGGAWVEREVTGPSPRTSAAMAYDVVGRRVVLFGGQTATVDAADTWVWDGAKWTELVSPSIPPASAAPSMAYNPKTDVLLLTSAGQTWSLGRDGSGWQYLYPAPSQARLVYDPTSSDVVAYAFGTPGLQLYRRGSTGWNVDQTTTRSGLTNGSLVPDVLRKRLVLVHQPLTLFLLVEEWDGTSWTQMSGLSAGTPAAAALDTLRRRAILFDTTRVTWSFDTLGETRLNPATSPSLRTSALAAYDERRDRVVLFGGVDPQSNLLDDTWEWDGQTWTDVSTATRPPPASAARAMTYDRARGKVVLVHTTQMWEWDGVAWQSSALAAPLLNRTGPALAYDPIRERVVWFGGQDSSALAFNDTWLLEPTGWVVQEPPFARPAPRSSASLTWDASRRRLVLYGGINDDMPMAFRDAWEWDGVRWFTVPVPQVTGVGGPTLTAFDGGGILFLGPSPPVRLVWRGADSAETCALPFDVDGDSLIGCADADCWFVCTPFCPPGTQCNSAQPPYCGDQQCASSESGFTCPDDCTAPAAQCGNAVCEAEMTSCPGDCAP